MLGEIAAYFNVKLTKLDTSDWDEVEAKIKKIIQSPAAAPSIVPDRAPVTANMQM